MNVTFDVAIFIKGEEIMSQDELDIITEFYNQVSEFIFKDVVPKGIIIPDALKHLAIDVGFIIMLYNAIPYEED